MAHQLYKLQRLLLNMYEKRMNTGYNPNDQAQVGKNTLFAALPIYFMMMLKQVLQIMLNHSRDIMVIMVIMPAAGIIHGIQLRKLEIFVPKVFCNENRSYRKLP